MTLQVEAVSLTYPGADRPALDRVSLEVAPGQVCAVLGPSGCGKSTLLRVVAGLERPSAGRVVLAGADLAGVPAHRRGMGLMFQDGQLFAHLDVAGNVAYPLRIRRTPRGQRRSQVRSALADVGLTGYERRAVATLSGGEQQRVALARALVASPGMMLLDEPFSSLDRDLRDRLGTQTREILTERGITSLVVTHDHQEAFLVAERVVVMARGQVLQAGALDRVWRRPVSEEVARFVGFEVLDGIELAEVRRWWGTGAEARIALRPEAVRVRAVAGPQAGAGQGPVTGRAGEAGGGLIGSPVAHLLDVRPTPGGQAVLVRLGGALLHGRASLRHSLRVGDAVQVTWDRDQSVVWETSTRG